MIEQEFSHRPELIASGGGIYDIHMDGNLLYSRRANNNEFPENEDIVNMIRKRISLA